MILDENKIKRKRKIAWAVLFILTLTMLAIVLIPVWLIQPFRPQTAREMEVAYTLRRWSPLLTALASIVVAPPANLLVSLAGCFTLCNLG